MFLTGYNCCIAPTQVCSQWLYQVQLSCIRADTLRDYPGCLCRSSGEGEILSLWPSHINPHFSLKKSTSSRRNPPANSWPQKAAARPLPPRGTISRDPESGRWVWQQQLAPPQGQRCQGRSGGRLGLLGGLAWRPDVGSLDPYL